jgi:DNA-binding transcriptional LysR family regulator
VELHHLATFVAVAEEGSFTRAADRLNVVQSTVSAGVRTLERELGGPLFDRTTHAIALTNAGHALLPEARTTLHAARAAREAVDAARGGLRGTVTLGVMEADALAPMRVAELLAAFRATHPKVELHARQANSDQMAAQVHDGRLDFAFVVLAAPHAPGLQLTPLTSQPLHLAVHENHPLASRASVKLSQIADESFADGPPGYGTRVAVDRAFAAAGLQRRVTLVVNDASTLIDFVRYGLAASFFASSFIRDRRAISLIPVRDHPPLFETYLVEPLDRKPSMAAAELIALAKRLPPPAPPASPT